MNTHVLGGSRVAQNCAAIHALCPFYNSVLCSFLPANAAFGCRLSGMITPCCSDEFLQRPFLAVSAGWQPCQLCQLVLVVCVHQDQAFFLFSFSSIESIYILFFFVFVFPVA